MFRGCSKIHPDLLPVGLRRFGPSGDPNFSLEGAPQSCLWSCEGHPVKKTTWDGSRMETSLQKRKRNLKKTHLKPLWGAGDLRGVPIATRVLVASRWWKNFGKVLLQDLFVLNDICVWRRETPWLQHPKLARGFLLLLVCGCGSWVGVECEK